MAEARVRFPWGLTIATALALALLLSLGIWQVQRLQWKERLIAEAEVAAKAPPIDIRNLQDFRGFEFQKLTLTCPGLDTAPYVELRTIHDGEPGVRLISLCISEPVPFAGQVGYRFVVDRGFVPEAVSARPPQQLSDKPVRITAEIRTVPDANGMTPPPEGHHFYGRDLAAMTAVLMQDRERLGAVGDGDRMLWGYWLYATTSSNPDWPALQPSAPPAAFSNNHLGYVLTWFGLALALLGFYIALLWRTMRPPALAGDTEKSSS